MRGEEKKRRRGCRREGGRDGERKGKHMDGARGKRSSASFRDGKKFHRVCRGEGEGRR